MQDNSEESFRDSFGSSKSTQEGNTQMVLDEHQTSQAPIQQTVKWLFFLHWQITHFLVRNEAVFDLFEFAGGKEVQAIRERIEVVPHQLVCRNLRFRVKEKEKLPQYVPPLLGFPLVYRFGLGNGKRQPAVSWHLLIFPWRSAPLGAPLSRFARTTTAWIRRQKKRRSQDAGAIPAPPRIVRICAFRYIPMRSCCIIWKSAGKAR